jgi:hypothetical protein
MTMLRSRIAVGSTVALFALATSARAQVDQARAATYFKEAAALCEREGGRLWGVSLCGPMVIADAQTRTKATNQPAPEVKPPPTLGMANAVIDWGGVRWSTVAWQYIPAGVHDRARLLMHELFHRIQPQLGLLSRDEPKNDHLDTKDGRYWMQLEWRALAIALATEGAEQLDATRDALAFRAARRRQSPGAAENERVLELNEGLAQYTGIAATTATLAERTTDAIDQLSKSAQAPSFVRTFAYGSGPAYGVLLDVWSPEWTRRLKPSDDLGELVARAANLAPAANPDSSAKRYGGPELAIAEERREADRRAREADFRRRFVEGPVLVVPRGQSATFTSGGITPNPGAGLIYPGYHTSADWGTLEAENVLVSDDRTTLTLPAPKATEGTTLKGDGWTLVLAKGWSVRPGPRSGDSRVVRDSTPP